MNSHLTGAKPTEIRFEDELFSCSRHLAPPPQLSLSQWANTFAVLSRETSAQTGKFRSYPYQDGMMDAITDPSVTYVSVMKSARVGYTKILDHVVGYYLAHDPSPILVVQPRVEDAEDYSKTEIAPMLRDTPVLADISGDPKAKNSNQTILRKTFSNGASLTLVGANSPGGFRRITCRIILFDEVDGYPAGGAGAEGDQIALGTKRSETFWNRKIVLGSTPTVKGVSRIEKAWLESDQRRYFVPCPHCGEYQVLEWGSKSAPYGIKWDKDEAGNGLPETAYYLCRHNACVIFHNELPGMLAKGEWRAGAPFRGHAGFHIWTGYSPHSNASWTELVADWLRVKNDPLMRQTFINTTLGEPYEDAGEFALTEKGLISRAEVWVAEVPDGVVLITIGVDTQDNRFEITVLGWGMNEECWVIAHDMIFGDLETAEPWGRLDAYLKQVWRRADGRGLVASAVCMDSGGHHTNKVYEFSKERIGRRIWAIKGESATGGKRNPVWPVRKVTYRTKKTFRPVILGVNSAKDDIRQRLHIEPDPGGAPVASCIHFPSFLDLHYYSQLLAESLVRKESGGQMYRVWALRPGRANEALDCMVYGYAALKGLIHHGLKLNRLAERAGTDLSFMQPPPDKPEEKTDFSEPGVVIPEPVKAKKIASLAKRLPR
ncbi:phage terminase large subunit family protein [Escherichia coli]|uniref:phage terminase large subunit family protein n=1 Tax=Escherichia coli TaxID=562 RepID=UPI001F1105F8|nr:phage terminase large subunit family protein [Escherichia coli]UMR99577.1 terminase [Escherichia coli]